MSPGRSSGRNCPSLSDAVPLLGPWGKKKGAASTWQDPLVEITQINPGRVGAWTISPTAEYLGVA